MAKYQIELYGTTQGTNLGMSSINFIHRNARGRANHIQNQEKGTVHRDYTGVTSHAVSERGRV